MKFGNIRFKNVTERFRHTPKGVLTNCYAGQLERSRAKGFPPPDYTAKDLQDLYLNDKRFKRLFSEWVKSGYKKEKKPSIDRINCKKPYMLGNINILTWEENRYKQRMETKVFRKTKIAACDKDGNIVDVYDSVSDAVVKTGLSQGDISSALSGHRLSYGGYVWKYLEPPKRKLKALKYIECPYCKQMFPQRNKTIKFCSRRCGIKFNWENHIYKQSKFDKEK